ncbi:MAG: sel1 repeat family protein [Deltaproteobacteria bacterium]|nr:sel1 repeat family protein [Deltaproteobacteria bacterium]
MLWTWVKRILLVGITLLGGSCGAFIFGHDYDPLPLPAEHLRAAVDQPIDEPGESLPRVDSGEVTMAEGRAPVEVSLDAGECTFIVAGAATAFGFGQLSLHDTASRQTLVHTDAKRVGALGWCAADAPLELTLWGTDGDDFGMRRTKDGDPPGSMVYRVHVGTPTEPWQRYIVGEASGEPLAALTQIRSETAGEARDAENAPSGEPLFRVDVGVDAAIALPRSPTTRWVAQALGAVGRETVEGDPHLEGEDRESEGTERPVALVDHDHARVLAVIDPTDLPFGDPVPCVRIHFSRLAEQGAMVGRLPIPSLEETMDTEHRLCPTDPPTAFVTTADDAAAWRIRVLRTEGPTRARAPSAVPSEPLVAHIHRQAVADCEAGDLGACAEASDHLAGGRFVPRDTDAAKRYGDRACRGAASHCGAYGKLLRDTGDQAGAVRAWQRACDDANVENACAAVGEMHRLGIGTPFDALAARNAYDRACRFGHQRSCARIETMDLLHLGT